MLSRRYTLTTLIFAGFFLGILFGWLIGEPILPVAEPMQDLFLRLLRMAIMPLVITSIVSAVIQVGSSKGLGKISLRTITYYITTSVLAILTGQVLVNIFKPGKGASIGLLEQPEGIGILMANSAVSTLTGQTLDAPVPVVVSGAGITADDVNRWDEDACVSGVMGRMNLEDFLRTLSKQNIWP